MQQATDPYNLSTSLWNTNDTTLWNVSSLQQYSHDRNTEKCHWLKSKHVKCTHQTRDKQYQNNCSKWPCARTRTHASSLEASPRTHQPLPHICHVLYWHKFVHASLPKCGNKPDYGPGCWADTCLEQWILESHDEAVPLFDVYDEPVHCPAESCKLHQQCSGWLTVIILLSAVRLDSSHRRFCYHQFYKAPPREPRLHKATGVITG